jgi:prolyl oligopeptidase
MQGGCRLLWTFACLFLLAAALSANTNKKEAAASREDDAASKTTPPDGPPKAKIEPVVDDYFGHKITDDYQYLENASSPQTQAYVREEMAYTRSLLDPLPGREKLRLRLLQLASVGTITNPFVGGNYYFYLRREGTQNQPVLLVREGVHGKDRPLVDVNEMAADGTVALDWWYPSDDGRYVAYGISAGGSEESTLHVVETATGKVLPDTIPRTRFSSVAWLKDDSAFYYTRRPKKGEVPAGEEVYHAKVFFHVLGSDPAKDPLIFGEGRNPQDIPAVSLPDDNDRWLLITVFEGWTKTEMYLQDLKAGTPPVPVTQGKNFIYQGEVFRDKLYITTNEDASHYRAFVVGTAHPQRENWKEIIPESDAVLQNLTVFGGRLLGQYEKNASSRLKLFDLDGKPLGDIDLPAIGTVFGLGGRWDRDQVFIAFQSFTIPPSVYEVNLASRQTALWDEIHVPVDPSDYQVKQVWFTSKDGTRVPMFLFHKKGIQLDGKNPTLLTGYGGFNISLTPTFVATRFVWLEHGGVYAVANLRGGAEFGEAWHRAGMLDKKQNVFDDFIAAAEFLISDKITDKDHLAIQGGSNGGLLMGAVFTQRPDLFRAVICAVPLLDMLRYQKFQIAKLWIPEYGSVDDPKQFQWLYAYSPYQHVKPGAEYPAIMFMTADTDTRVDPMHAKKMAALMQAEAANGRSRSRPILLRVETKAGHGAGKPVTKQIEEGVDIYSFLFWQLGVTP